MGYRVDSWDWLNPRHDIPLREARSIEMRGSIPPGTAFQRLAGIDRPKLFRVVGSYSKRQEMCRFKEKQSHAVLSWQLTSTAQYKQASSRGILITP